jgi:hypothetical protein
MSEAITEYITGIGQLLGHTTRPTPAMPRGRHHKWCPESGSNMGIGPVRLAVSVRDVFERLASTQLREHPEDWYQIDQLRQIVWPGAAAYECRKPS